MSAEQVSVALNGYGGEIGRPITRELSGLETNLKWRPLALVYVNNRTRPTDMLLMSETATVTHYPGYEVGENELTTPTGSIETTHVSNIEGLKKGADLLLEATGAFKTQGEIERLLEKYPKVILGTPFSGEVDHNKYPTIVKGVNENIFKPEKHKGISSASCTTTNVVLTLQLLGLGFKGVENVTGITGDVIHAYTPSQNRSQGTHYKEGAMVEDQDSNILFTTTGASKAISKVLPSLRGKVGFKAFRVNAARGSITNMVITLEKPVKRDHLIAQAREMVEMGKFGDLVKVASQEDNVLSAKRVLANLGLRNKAAILLEDSLQVLNGGYMISVSSWFNNVDGYVNAWLQLAKFVAEEGF